MENEKTKGRGSIGEVRKMELDEAINLFAEAKVAMRNPGIVALRLCECCIHVSMPAPDELITKGVIDVIIPDSKELKRLRIQ